MKIAAMKSITYYFGLSESINFHLSNNLVAVKPLIPDQSDATHADDIQSGCGRDQKTTFRERIKLLSFSI